MANGDSIFAGSLIKKIIISSAIAFTAFSAVSGLRVLSLASNQEGQETRLCTVERKVDETQAKGAETREKVEREGAKNDARYEAILRTLERIERKLP